MSTSTNISRQGNGPDLLGACKGTAFLWLTFLLLPGSAYAYLDPGTGSLIIQMVVAGSAAALVIARNYWTTIKGIFGGKSSDLDADNEDNGDN
jgi:hypothetical protein